MQHTTLRRVTYRFGTDALDRMAVLLRRAAKMPSFDSVRVTNAGENMIVRVSYFV